jgi:hypothetical protein
VITNVFHIQGLREGEGSKDAVTNDIAAKKPRNWTEVFNIKAKTECGFEGQNKGAGATNKEVVVHIDGKDVQQVRDENSEHGGVNGGLSEAEGDEPGCEKGIPGARGITDAVESLVKLANKTSAS